MRTARHFVFLRLTCNDSRLIPSPDRRAPTEIAYGPPHTAHLFDTHKIGLSRLIPAERILGDMIEVRVAPGMVCAVLLHVLKIVFVQHHAVTQNQDAASALSKPASLPDSPCRPSSVHLECDPSGCSFLSPSFRRVKCVSIVRAETPLSPYQSTISPHKVISAES